MHLPAHLPGPLRAAVGLVASAADEAKNLPDRAIELPMLAVSTALQLSLRAQQRYAQLTVRGDEAVSALSRRNASDEPPAWATFDDDPAATPANGAEHPTDHSDEHPDETGSTPGETSITAVSDEPVSAPISASGPVPADIDPDPAPTGADNPDAPDNSDAPAPAGASAKKTAASRKAPAKKAARRTASAKSNGKGVSAPRHTTPSRFDTIGDE